MSVDANTYGTVAGIERLIGDIVPSRTFDTDTTPSTAQVEAELDNAAMELNRELDQVGYTVPVSQSDYPTAYGFLKAANEYGAAAMLLNIAPSEGFESSEDVEAATPTRSQTYSNRFKSALKSIREKRLHADWARNRLGRIYAGSQEDSDGNEKLPIFSRGQDDYPGRRSLIESD